MDKDTNLIFEQYKQVNEDLGLGHGTPKMIRITSIGSTNPMKRKTEQPIRGEDESIFIQAGDKEEEGCGCDDCGCGEKQENDGRQIYDGEIDMARSELLKANEYAAKLFDHIGKSDYLEGWVASKITKAADYLSSVYHYLDYEDNFPTKEPCYSDEEDGEDEDEDKKIEVDDYKAYKTARNTGFAGA